MKVLIQEAGVGEQFSAHSIWGAASTAAVMKGMSISEALCIADWSSDNVFKTLYFKPTDTRPQFFLNTITDDHNMMLIIIMNNIHYNINLCSQYWHNAILMKMIKIFELKRVLELYSIELHASHT